MNNVFKRFLALVLCLVTFAGMLPAYVHADNSSGQLSEDSAVRVNPLYAHVLTEADLVRAPASQDDKSKVETWDSSSYLTSKSKVGAIIREAMKDRQATVTVRYKSSTYHDDLHEEVFDAALVHTGVPTEGDYLHWEYGGYYVSWSYYQGSDSYWYIEFDYEITYYTTAAQEAQMDTAVSNLLSTLNLSGASDYEKVCGIYDYICKNITYDYANLNVESHKLKYTAYAALVNKTAVCQGYAVLFYRLALELGVDARVVTGYGNGGRHAWNIVKLGKRYYLLDSTWDAEWKQAGYNYNYFLRGSQNFNTDHTPEDSWSGYNISVTDCDPNNIEIIPAAPTLKVTGVASSGKPKLTWNAVEGAAEYQVYRSTSKNGTYKWLATVTGTSQINKNAEAGKLYYYKIRAVSAAGDTSSWSNIVSRTCDLPRPTVKITSDAATGKPKLTWDTVEGATKYEVYRSTSKDGTYEWLVTTSGTSQINKNAVTGKLYYYKVRAIHSNTKANSAYSTVVSRTCDLARPTVKITNDAATGKPKLTWDAIEGATKYEVYRSTSKTGTYTWLATVTGTSQINKNAVAGKKYYYKVIAVHSNTKANSAYSAAVGRTCDLPRPTLKVALNSAGKPKLTWDAIEGAIKYQVYRSTDGENWDWLATVTGTSQVNKNAVAGTKYYYRIQAIHSNSEANSAYSAKKYITAK